MREQWSVILVRPGRRLVPWYVELTIGTLPTLGHPLQAGLQRGTGWGGLDCLYRLCRPSRRKERDPPLPVTGQSGLGFQHMCEERRLDPLSWAVGSIVSLLQCVDRGLCHTMSLATLSWRGFCRWSGVNGLLPAVGITIGAWGVGEEPVWASRAFLFKGVVIQDSFALSVSPQLLDASWWSQQGYSQTKPLHCFLELKEFIQVEGHTTGCFLSSTPCRRQGGKVTSAKPC